MPQRIILHIDLDAFYASVEAVRQPALRGKPVVVCMLSGRGDGGAVATASYEARKLGIHSGQSLQQARARASKDTAFLPADREHYRKVSDRVMSLFRRHAATVEQRSIDEAYLDVSGMSWSRAAALGRKIKKQLLEQEKLTCSVGIGQNKLVAKMASRQQKPDGLTIARSFRPFANMPVDKLFGIGPRTLETLKQLRVKTIKDLARADEKRLRELFGDNKGALLREHANGRDSEPVAEVAKQQLSRLATLPEDTSDPTKIIAKLTALTADLHRKIKKERISFRTVTLIAISTRQGMKTRSATLDSPTRSRQFILTRLQHLLKEFQKEHPGKLRRVGVRVSSLGRPEKKEKPQRSLAEF